MFETHSTPLNVEQHKTFQPHQHRAERTDRNTEFKVENGDAVGGLLLQVIFSFVLT